MMEVKIIGTLYALPPLKSPSALLKWFVYWKFIQIVGPALARYQEAAHRASDAFKRFTEALKDIDLEEK